MADTIIYQYGPYYSNSIDDRGGGVLDSMDLGSLTSIYDRVHNFYITDDNDQYADGDDRTYDLGDNNTNTFTNTWELENSGNYSPNYLMDAYRYGFYEYVQGTNQSDTVKGGPQPDNITTYDGDDVIWGWSDPFESNIAVIDDDFIDAGDGNDIVHAEFGDDTVYGKEGDDTLFGFLGDDILSGHEGDDYISGGLGSDELMGGEGNDFISTGDLSTGDSDYVNGGEGADAIVLGVASQEQTIPGEAFDFGSLALSIVTDFSDLAFTHATNDTKKNTKGEGYKSRLSTAKEIAPIIVKSIRAWAEYDGSDTVIPSVEGEYATIEFDPREDILFVPVNDGVSNVLVTDDTNLESDLGFTYDVGGNMFAAINLPDELSTVAKGSMADQLVQNALVINSNGAVLGSGSSSDTIDIPDALGGTGSKFFVFGAWGPQFLEGQNGADYLYGTNYGDILTGYTSYDGQDAQTTGNAFDPASAGSDQLFGYGGNDVFMGGKSGAGNDLFFGGEGTDYASYVDSEAGIVANLGTVLSDTNGDYLLVSNDGFGTPDRLYSVENIIGSPQEDTVSFNDTNSTSDQAVEVKVYSSEGTQTPGEGEINVLMEVENIIGSDSSNDTIDFSNLDGPLEITANSDEATTIVDTSTEQTYTVTDFETIIVDSVSGELIPSGQVTLDGLTLGNATIKTGNIMGTGGDDELEGSSLNDFISGGSGADTLDGGKGADIFYFSGGSGGSESKTIKNFDPSEDIILIDSQVYQVSDTRNIIYSQEGDNLSLKISGETQAIIEDVNEISKSDITYFTSSLPEWMTSQEIEVNSAPVTFSGDIRPGHDTIGTLPAQVVDTGIDNLTVGSGGWVSYDQFPRATGDFDGDGYEDVIGFGGKVVFTYSSNSDGTFADKQSSIEGDFTYSGNGSSLGKSWDSQNTHPRVIGDIDGDGNDDIVGFHEDAIYSSLSNGDGTFTTPQIAYDHNPEFTHEWGWTSQDKNPRTLADVNGDGYDDIIGFSNGPVRVALANGDGTFANAYSDLDDFGYNHGYTSQDEYPRMVGDLNGDGFADILAINDSKLNVAFGHTNGNGTFMLASDYFNEFKGSGGDKRSTKVAV